MTEWIRMIVVGFSYTGVAFLMFLENVFPPIPSELIMPLVGFFSSQGHLSFVGIVIAGTTGATGGALVLFWLGRRAGHARLRRWIERRGHWIALSVDDLEKATAWFDRNGASAVFLGRLVPGVRSLVSIPAGVAAMPLGRFLVLTTLGSVIWTTALAWAGRLLGSNYAAVERVVGPLSSAILVGVTIWFVARVIRLRRRRTLPSAQDA